MRLVVYPMIFKALYIPGGAGFLPSTVAMIYSPIFIRNTSSLRVDFPASYVSWSRDRVPRIMTPSSWGAYSNPQTKCSFDAVDDWNPAPVEVGSLSHDLQAFIHPRWLFGISDPSTVPQPTAIDNCSHRQNSVDTLDVWLSQLVAMQPERRINGEHAIETRPGASIEITPPEN